MKTTSHRGTRSYAERHRIRTLLEGRVVGLPSWVVLTQLFIGFGWLRAVAEKVIDAQWWTGVVITDFVSEHQEATLGWYRPFIDAMVIPSAAFTALAVLLGQAVAAVSLTTGRRLAVGLGVGMFLNLNFMAAGAVAPSAFYLLAQGAIALWMAERQPTAASIRGLAIVSAAALFLAAASLPFISTVHPHDVIEDPAMMFAFGGSLASVACLLAGRADQAPHSKPPATSYATTPASFERRGEAMRSDRAFSTRVDP